MYSSATPQVPFSPTEALNLENLNLQASTPIENPSSSTPSDDDIATSISYIPGDPAVSLIDSDVNSYLSSQLKTPLLDELYDRLWIVARKDGQNINKLHVQRMRGRNIIPCESPRLHLVWHGDRIYIKPIPLCLLNHSFWTKYLSLPENKETCLKDSQDIAQTVTPPFDRSIAIGFLRSYAFLIRHELDFILAKEAHLIHRDIDWIKWSKFINKFRHLGDEQVAKRYHYGQLRLSRLNWIVRLFRPNHSSTKLFYEVPHWSTIYYIARLTVPLLFMFASISLILSSMQVLLAVPTDAPLFKGLDSYGIQGMQRTFWIFSILVLLLSGAVWLLLFGFPLCVIAWQLMWGYKQEKRRRKAAHSLNV